MFYPSGETPNGKTVVCIEDERSELDKLTEGCEDFLAVEEITEWLAENDYCLESWQMKDYLLSKGINESLINEDMAAGGAPAPAGAPAPGTRPGGRPCPRSRSGAATAGAPAR